MTYRFDSGLPSAKSAAAKTAALLRSFHDGLAYDFECSIPELETKLQALAWATARHTLPELFHLCIPRPRGISTVRKVDHPIVDLKRVSIGIQVYPIPPIKHLGKPLRTSPSGKPQFAYTPPYPIQKHTQQQ